MRVRSPFRALHALLWRRGLVEAQLIVTRRCNLSCGYCHEFDNTSQPIPLEALRERIEALHRLHVVQICLLGGEPLLHPEIEALVRAAGRRAQVSITTNGFLLTSDLIARLNDAGLTHMQVSIDALSPSGDLYIQKSLRSVKARLRLLQEEAAFGFHANVVLCEASRAGFPELLAELGRLGVPVSIGLHHDRNGRALIAGEAYRDLWDRHYRGPSPASRIEEAYGRHLLEGRTPAWQCRAGSRHLYVDEHGRAQYCASQRGRLDRPIVAYTRADMRAQAKTRKGCESGCSIFCVYRASRLDNEPLAVARSVLRSILDGGIRLPGFRGRATGAAASRAAATD